MQKFKGNQLVNCIQFHGESHFSNSFLHIGSYAQVLSISSIERLKLRVNQGPYKDKAPGMGLLKEHAKV